MADNNQIVPIENIQSMIFTIRDTQVMIDRDLAQIYQVENKRLNEQVKRNISRFPEEFRFQLTNAEKEELVANCDRFESHDRFLIIDNETVYHIGASLKDLGKKWFAFSKMDKSGLKIMERVHKIMGHNHER